MDNMHAKIMPPIKQIQAAVANLHTNEDPFVILELSGTQYPVHLEAR